MTRSRIRTPAAWLGVITATLALLAVPVTATAADGDVSWSVTPSDASGSDGRAVIEHELDPGESTEDHVAVRNLGAEAVTFRLSAADGYYNASGRFDMLPSDQKSVAAGTWIALPDSVTLQPGQTAVVPFEITVPKDAEPGDHAAGVAASVVSASKDGGAGVGVESRVGVKVMTRVTGELKPAFDVQGLTADHRLSWNPFRPGSLAVAFDVVNTGNTRLNAAGELRIAGQMVRFPAEDGRPQQLLPGESRSFALVLDDVWPLFALSGELTLSPTANGVDGAGVEVAPRTAAVLAWAMPWPQLIVLIGLGLIVWALLWNRIRSRRRLQHLIAQAREEGRAQSAQEATP